MSSGTSVGIGITQIMLPDYEGLAANVSNYIQQDTSNFVQQNPLYVYLINQ